jgi:hypothetical protein
VLISSSITVKPICTSEMSVHRTTTHKTVIFINYVRFVWGKLGWIRFGYEKEVWQSSQLSALAPQPNLNQIKPNIILPKPNINSPNPSLTQPNVTQTNLRHKKLPWQPDACRLNTGTRFRIKRRGCLGRDKTWCWWNDAERCKACPSTLT